MKQIYRLSNHNGLMMQNLEIQNLSDSEAWKKVECIIGNGCSLEMSMPCHAYCAGFKIIEQTTCPTKCIKRSETCKQSCQGTVIYYQAKLCNGRVIDLESEVKL